MNVANAGNNIKGMMKYFKAIHPFPHQWHLFDQVNHLRHHNY